MKSINLLRAVASASIMLVANISGAQGTFPQQPIRIIVPSTAGGGTDLIARILTNGITTNTKWSMIVDNRPGASGVIGMDAVAKAKADGYTLGMGLTATLAINPELFRKLPYDPGQGPGPGREHC